MPPRSKQKIMHIEGPATPKKARFEANSAPPTLPNGVSLQQYIGLRAKWSEKLSTDNFEDLEVWSRLYGVPMSWCKAVGNSPKETLDILVKEDALEYYRLCSCFLEHADWPALFGTKAERFKLMFELHSEGATYRAVAKHFRHNVPDRLKRPKASEFWSHWNIKRIVDVMYRWHTQHPEGLLHPEPADEP